MPILPPSNQAGLDKRLWLRNKQLEFIVASAYQRLNGFHAFQHNGAWKMVKKIKAPEIVKVFT